MIQYFCGDVKLRSQASQHQYLEERGWTWERRLSSKTIRCPILRTVSVGLEAGLGDLEDMASLGRHM
jgi:hypothetical protein